MDTVSYANRGAAVDRSAAPAKDVAMLRETRYARNGAYGIAYQVFGDGPIDIVLGLGWISNLDAIWEEPQFASFMSSFAGYARVVAYDARGVGLSDAIPLGEPVSLDDRVGDLRAVMDAAGTQQAALVAMGLSGPIFARFAVRSPERVRALVLISSASHGSARATTAENGSVVVDLDTVAPSAAREPSFVAWWSAYQRRSASPGSAQMMARLNADIDVRAELSQVQAPTLIVHRTGDRAVPIVHAREVTASIPGAVLFEAPGADHLPFIGDQVAITGEIEQFLTGRRRTPDLDQVLATIAAIEVVDIAETALTLGDRRWAEIWTRVRAMLKEEIELHHGRRAFSTLNGVVASFADPERAAHFALKAVRSAQPLGITARAGLHSGELVVVNAGVAGVAIHLALRVASLAAPGEVLISDTARGLAAGADLTFEPGGEHPIPGHPGEWRVYRVGHATGDAPTSILRTRGERPAVALSRREREIASLLALGLSNRQIGDELVISTATVERHVANMLAKLGYRSRTQIAAWVVDQGLLSPAT
jgi:pimeloyl-ACP methyl ester carboxylesterase/class 3 adenylate cyclase